MVLLYILLILTTFFFLDRIVDLFFNKSSYKISKDIKYSSDAAISTIIAVDSSVPELFIARQDLNDMTVSKAIGSNIFDILIDLGLPFLIFLMINEKSIGSVHDDFLYPAFMLFASMLAIFLPLIFSNWKIGKTTGYFLLLLYFIYLTREINILYI